MAGLGCDKHTYLLTWRHINFTSRRSPYFIRRLNTNSLIVSKYLPAGKGHRNLPLLRWLWRTNSKLCRICQFVISTNDLNAFINNPLDDRSSADMQVKCPHYSNDQDLRKFALAGCLLCTILWDSFSDRENSTMLKCASFVLDLRYEGEANAEKCPCFACIPYYRFNMCYNDFPLANTNTALHLLQTIRKLTH